jgi:predicted nucleotidyltransferase
MKLIYQSKPKIKFQNLSREDWTEKLSQDLKKIPGYLKAYFYGSFARSEDEPWSDVDIIIILENQTLSKNSFLDNLLFVSHYISDYPELEAIVYTNSQWENIISDTNPVGFWKDVRKDLLEI